MAKKYSSGHNLPLFTTPFKYFALLILLSLVFSCTQNTIAFTAGDAAIVRSAVIKLADNTAIDISGKGPIAWLDYFENAPDFFMASDGSVAFTGYSAADSFIKNTLVKQIPHINLKWSNLRINPLNSQFAIMAANFHEDLTDAGGKVIPVDGYFTATAHKTENGWKYLNMHWSIKKTIDI